MVTRNWRDLPFWKWAPGMRFHALGDSFMVIRCAGGPAMVLNSGPISSFRRWSQEELNTPMTLVEDAALLGHVQSLIAEECLRRDGVLFITHAVASVAAIARSGGWSGEGSPFVEQFTGDNLADALWQVARWLADNPVPDVGGDQ